MEKKPVIVVTMGDPAGIGPEVAVKSLAKPETSSLANLVLVGDKKILEQALKTTNTQARLHCIEHVEEGIFEPGVINVIDLDNVDLTSYEQGKVQKQCGAAAFAYIQKAHELCMNHQADAMATTTINKEALKAAGLPALSHTDILKDLCGLKKDPLTMFQVKTMRTTFYSKHCSLIEACRRINKDGIKKACKQTDQALRQLGMEHPRIAVAGLNPHCSDHGLFGSEEAEHIIPAIEELKQEGKLQVFGPIGADSVYFQALEGKYDCVLSLYHDQGHIAAKTLDHDRTISLTFGLPYLRTSVDHGTAFDIAGQGIASEISMDEAIRLAALYAPLFQRI